MHNFYQKDNNYKYKYGENIQNKKYGINGDIKLVRKYRLYIIKMEMLLL